MKSPKKDKDRDADTEERKKSIRRKLTLSRYPKRSRAVFTPENDHNPTVLAACLKCGGYGKYDTFHPTSDGRIQELHLCEECEGTGVRAETEPYFTNNNDPITVNARPDGWLKCPHCGWRFTITDKNAFTGLRHMRCGQKLDVTKERN